MWLTGLVAPWHVGSSQTGARTRVSCIGRQILNHCATREALFLFLIQFLKVIIGSFYPFDVCRVCVISLVSFLMLVICVFPFVLVSLAIDFYFHSSFQRTSVIVSLFFSLFFSVLNFIDYCSCIYHFLLLILLFILFFKKK